MYSTAYIDGELILRRNWSVLVRHNRLSVPGLVKSFFQSITKMSREMEFREVVLLFDKRPYHKLEYLDDYKGDRVYATEEDLTPDKSEEELARIQTELDNFKVKSDAKYFIIFNFSKIGIPSLIKGGWEADDWAHLASRSDRTNNKEDKSVVISKDNDWIMNVSPKMDCHIVSKSNNKTFTYQEMTSLINGDPYFHYSLHYSLNGSHNFLKKTVVDTRTYTLDEIKELIKNQDFSFTQDKDLFTRQLASFDVTKYPEYDKCMWMINNIPDKKEYMTINQFNEFSIEHHLGITGDYYMSFINNLNK